MPRSKTKTLTCAPVTCADLPVWNYDGSSTEQAEGHNSEVLCTPELSSKILSVERHTCLY